MAITAASLALSGTDTDGTSFATASVSPAADKLILASVLVRRSTSPVSEVTCVGNGITWTPVAASLAFNSLGSPNTRLAVFRGSHASPSAGAITFDLGGVTHTSAQWSIAELTGVDLAQGDQGVIQVVTDAQTALPITVTLAAFGHADNATYEVGGIIGVVTLIQEAGYTNVGGRFQNNSTIRAAILDANDTTPSFTTDSGTVWAMFGIELAAVVAGSPNLGAAMHHHLRTMGCR